MDDKTSQLLEALKYASSDRFKSVQRKLTTAQNIINNDALAYPFDGFFSLEEKDALRAAAQILGSFKRKVEHAKEVRAREEQLRKAHLDHCAAERRRLLGDFLVKPETVDEHIQAVLFHLALFDHSDQISRGSYFGHSFGRIKEDLARGMSQECKHLSVNRVALECLRESKDWLLKNLWPYDSIPDQARIEVVSREYRDVWRAKTLLRYEDFLNRYRAALCAERGEQASLVRSKEADARRRSMKVVK